MAIYVFGEPGSLLVKVGYTGNPPQRRLQDLRWSLQMPNAEILYLGQGTRLDEKRAHRLLRGRSWFQSEHTIDRNGASLRCGGGVFFFGGGESGHTKRTAMG